MAVRPAFSAPRDIASACSSVMTLNAPTPCLAAAASDRKSTRLNSSHSQISYAVLCLKKIAGIQSATSRQNTKDQVYAQNEMLAYQQKESTARVASIMENTNLSKQQQVSEIMRQMLTQAQTAGQYFTNDQIKEMTRKVSAEVDLVHQQTQNQRYGSSYIGATAKDISNVVTHAASGVVDIFHGIDKAVADTWNNFWKDGKADGIGSNLSRK